MNTDRSAIMAGVILEIFIRYRPEEFYGPPRPTDWAGVRGAVSEKRKWLERVEARIPSGRGYRLW